MVISFKRSDAVTAALSAPNLATGHHRPTPLPETPGHSWACLGQFLTGSLLLSPGSWCAQDFICALQESLSPILCKFWQLCGGVNGDLLQEGLCRIRSGSVSVGSPGVHKVLFEPLSILVGLGFDSKCSFAPSTFLLGLPLCPWIWGIS